MPANGFDRGRAAYVAPPEDGSSIELEIDPDERAAAGDRSRGPPGTARTSSTCRCCMKTKGKTTTDHISPAGPWLRYRGHLDQFSDNLLLGAINAYTGERGTTIDVLTGRGRAGRSRRSRATTRAQGIPLGGRRRRELRRRQQPRARRAVPRLLGGAAVIARSFARIHESNLKKQGLLALTFSDPADYDKIREDDRVSVDRPLGPDAGQAGDMPRHACRRHDHAARRSSTRSRPRRSSGSGRARR